MKIFIARNSVIYLYSQSVSMVSDLLSKGDIEKIGNKNKLSQITHLKESHIYNQLTYEICLQSLYLTNKCYPVKMGLQNMKYLHESLGNPMDSPGISIIHVAGTNGKGSVAFKISQTLRFSGLNVGLFISPHLSCFRERIQINGILISESEVTLYLPHILHVCKSRCIPATLFEVTTALAFKFFSKRKTDVIILETGLGGRLDATNIIHLPTLCIITSIGLDHKSILGNTFDMIAREKSGIIKKDVPILVGCNISSDVILNYAKTKGASCYYTYSDIIGKFERFNIKIRDAIFSRENIEVIDYEVENSNLATAAVYLLCKYDTIGKFNFITENNIIRGTSCTLPSRFEIFQSTKRNSLQFYEYQTHSAQIPKSISNYYSIFNDNSIDIVFDVAHNPSAITLLAAKLQKTYPTTRKRLLVGLSSDKDLFHCFQCLIKIVDTPNNIHLIQASHPRAATIDTILYALPYLLKSNYDMSNRSILKQIHLAFDKAYTHNEILIVCGSVFIMSEARNALGLDEPKDIKQIFECDSWHMKDK